MRDVEGLMVRATDAFQGDDLDAYLGCWDTEATLKPLGIDRTYRGHDEIKLFFEEAHRRSLHSDLELHSVVQQQGLALGFGTLPAGRSAFWVAEARGDKLLSLEGFRNVREAFDAFRPRATKR